MNTYFKWLLLGTINTVCIFSFFMKSIFLDVGSFFLNFWMILFCFSEYVYLTNYFENKSFDFKDFSKILGMVLLNFFWILFNYTTEKTGAGIWAWALIVSVCAIVMAGNIIYAKIRKLFSP